MRTSAKCLVALVAGLAVVSASSANDLCHLSDEFDDPSRLVDWFRVHQEERWFADQLEVLDVDGLHPGELTLIPYTVSWYQDWRGPLLFKDVSGDFVVSTSLTVTARDGVSVPGSLFSLGGIMVREPRQITPMTWLPGDENYVFLSVGYGNANPPAFQYEVKTTEDSQSVLHLSSAPGPSVEFQFARFGEYLILLRREPGNDWVIHRRYHRADFGSTLQVGMVGYTDWNKVSTFDPYVHNSTVITPPLEEDPAPQIPFTPDLMARYEYVRFERGELPVHLEGLDLSDEVLVPDAELLAFLGDAAIPEPAEECSPTSVHNDDVFPSDSFSAAGSLRWGGISPHPLNASSGLTETPTLSLELVDPGFVQVTVHDASGRQVASLFEKSQAAGSLVVSIPGSLAAGRYWVRATLTELGTRRVIGRTSAPLVRVR